MDLSNTFMSSSLAQDPSPGTCVTASPAEIAQGFAETENGPHPLPKLFQPLKIRSTAFKNRLWVSPMCMYSAHDGYANDFHLVHYGQLAMRGVGAVVIEATGVLPEGRLTPKCLGLWHDGHITGLKRVVDYMHNFGAMVGVQLSHPGRKGSTIPFHMYGKRPNVRVAAEEGGWPDGVFGPSEVAYNDQHWEPRQMALDYIKTVQKAFVNAAARASQAGFDFIEIHGAHGYLINQFLSPLSNTRTDMYGGSFENRIRFVSEIVQGVRKVWPAEKPLFVRLSVREWVEGGWTVDDSIVLTKKMHELGVDLVGCSSAGNDTHEKVPASPGYLVPLSSAIKECVPGILTGAVGIITGGKQANNILEQGMADVIFAGRQFLHDPSFVMNSALELGVFIKWADQYERGRPKTQYSAA